MKVKYSFNLSRVLKHIKDNSFGIVSAYLGELSLKENKERQKKLKNMVKSKGYGYKEIKGFWKSDDSDKLEEEYALFVPKVSYEDIKTFGKEFGQDAVIYGNKEEIVLFDTKNNKVIRQFTDIQTNPNQSWDLYSKIKNKSFKFSSVDWYMSEPPEKNSFMRAMVCEAWEDLNKQVDITDEEDFKISTVKKAIHKIK